MTVFGKILVFLNTLLVIAFILLAAPIVNYRTSRQNQIAKLQLEIDGEPQKPGLRAQLAEKRNEIEQLNREMTLLLKKGRDLKTLTNAEVEQTRLKIADQENRLKTERDIASRAANSVTSVKVELQAREEEVNMFTKELSSETLLADRQAKVVADLKKTLATTKSEIASVLSSVKSTYNMLKDLESRYTPQNSTGGNMAAGNR